MQLPPTIFCVDNIHCRELVINWRHSSDRDEASAVVDAIVSERRSELRRAF